MSNPKLSSNAIDAVLPQTQCEECGFKGCKPYAAALAKGEATIDLCPPGGTKTLLALSQLLNIDATPYLPKAQAQYRAPSVAKIDENLCIGCVKCINACPVDAIVGAAKLMHTVVTDLCTGCGLCVEPCPMDCISMEALPERSVVAQEQKAQQWRAQHEFHLARLAQDAQEKATKHQAAKLAQERRQKQAAIAAAVARVKAKRELA